MRRRLWTCREERSPSLTISLHHVGFLWGTCFNSESYIHKGANHKLWARWRGLGAASVTSWTRSSGRRGQSGCHNPQNLPEATEQNARGPRRDGAKTSFSASTPSGETHPQPSLQPRRHRGLLRHPHPCLLWQLGLRVCSLFPPTTPSPHAAQPRCLPASHLASPSLSWTHIAGFR